jgi:putative membrane protein
MTKSRARAGRRSPLSKINSYKVKKSRSLKIILIFAIVLAAIVSCIRPIYPDEIFLQHIGTLLMLFLLASDLKSNRMSHPAFACLAVFTFIHILGARYIYSFVPYNKWILDISGFNMDSYFHLGRNQFDRFVHLVFGILFFPYLFQLISSWKGLSLVKAILVSWLILQTCSMLYELFEWSISVYMSAEIADGYNGQQGDPWDAQKDMALALLGSSVMSLAYLIRSILKRKQ